MMQPLKPVKGVASDRFGLTMLSRFVADHMAAAKKGLAAIIIEWDEGPNAKLTTGDIQAELENATLKPGTVAQNIGDVDKGHGECLEQDRSDLLRSLPCTRGHGAD